MGQLAVDLTIPRRSKSAAFPDTVSFENVTRGDRNGKDSNSDDVEVLPVRELKSSVSDWLCRSRDTPVTPLVTTTTSTLIVVGAYTSPRFPRQLQTWEPGANLCLRNAVGTSRLVMHVNSRLGNRELTCASVTPSAHQALRIVTLDEGELISHSFECMSETHGVTMLLLAAV
ncbi:hypothetical protein CROQUDRAFT_94282 [Cronartium quercuum f. sp. fusiforme G11]|uniref:Uncharacterized protein n=1 Tax=Cronartium quercuum f. sp. fusiforme G11 TaxID=708437 RepID=A0A9P6NE24_9BASI|nr:hypothetical protein CROQUDRAFT_94282 [Cronartium quercuum f. sp. fusiforme G11]